MQKQSTLCDPALIAADDAGVALSLRAVLAPAALRDSAEDMGLFGRWWCDTQTGQWVLSTGAARLLDVNAGLHRAADSCFEQVVPGDVLTLLVDMHQLGAPDLVMAREFRIINELAGLRWLRMASLPPEQPGSALRSGVVVDVTASRLAAMRERFCFE